MMETNNKIQFSPSNSSRTSTSSKNDKHTSYSGKSEDQDIVGELQSEIKDMQSRIASHLNNQQKNTKANSSSQQQPQPISSDMNQIIDPSLMELTKMNIGRISSSNISNTIGVIGKQPEVAPQGKLSRQQRQSLMVTKALTGQRNFSDALNAKHQELQELKVNFLNTVGTYDVKVKKLLEYQEYQMFIAVKALMDKVTVELSKLRDKCSQAAIELKEKKLVMKLEAQVKFFREECWRLTDENIALNKTNIERNRLISELKQDSGFDHKKLLYCMKENSLLKYECMKSGTIIKENDDLDKEYLQGSAEHNNLTRKTGNYYQKHGFARKILRQASSHQSGKQTRSKSFIDSIKLKENIDKSLLHSDDNFSFNAAVGGVQNHQTGSQTHRAADQSYTFITNIGAQTDPLNRRIRNILNKFECGMPADAATSQLLNLITSQNATQAHEIKILKQDLLESDKQRRHLLKTSLQRFEADGKTNDVQDLFLSCLHEARRNVVSRLNLQRASETSLHSGSVSRLKSSMSKHEHSSTQLMNDLQTQKQMQYQETHELTKGDKLALMEKFLTSHKFLQILQNMIFMKPCCHNPDCLYNMSSIEQLGISKNQLKNQNQNEQAAAQQSLDAKDSKQKLDILLKSLKQNVNRPAFTIEMPSNNALNSNNTQIYKTKSNNTKDFVQNYSFQYQEIHNKKLQLLQGAQLSSLGSPLNKQMQMHNKNRKRINAKLNKSIKSYQAYAEEASVSALKMSARIKDNLISEGNEKNKIDKQQKEEEELKYAIMSQQNEDRIIEEFKLQKRNSHITQNQKQQKDAPNQYMSNLKQQPYNSSAQEIQKKQLKRTTPLVKNSAGGYMRSHSAGGRSARLQRGLVASKQKDILMQIQSQQQPYLDQTQQQEDIKLDLFGEGYNQQQQKI